MRINRKQRLYILPCGDGYTCLGFDVAEKRRRAVHQWLHGSTPAPMRVGTKKHWAAYHDTMVAGALTSKGQCPAELTPALIGLEGCRVRVMRNEKELARFIVGKSTGWMPCHLALKRRDSTGGVPAYVPEGASVIVI